MVSQIVFAQNGTTRMTTSKQYDNLNRLTQISSVGGTGSTPSQFNYAYNTANQRVRTTQADGSYWIYQYDSLGQVTSGHKFWADGTPVAGQQFDYSFDTIGNRTQTKVGGDQHGWNQRLADYTVNSLNQYTSRDVPGYLDVLGVSFATNTVTVNGATAYRKGEYFWDELSLNNSAAPLWESVTVAATGQSTVSGDVFVPKTPEAFSYDADGNLTSDRRWNFTWDAENRLVQMVSDTAVGPQQLIKFEYDAQGRRIRKQMWNNTGGTGSPAVDERFVYDGWNLVAVLSPQSSVLASFTWGNDLSGSPQGAGGVGGLLEVSASGTNCFVAFDGNGNVAALVNAADGTTVANYEYGPFGEVIRATGAVAKANPFRFSTKYQDDESDLLYYGYRYYDPSTGRWLSRDPIGEQGTGVLHAFRTEDSSEDISGPNLSCALQNDLLDSFDGLGLLWYRFEPVVGQLTGLIDGAGRWGQPWFDADGSADARSKSAHTFEKVWSGSTSGGSCNTVKFNGLMGDDAGAINVYAFNGHSRQYRLYFLLTYEIKTAGPYGNMLIKVYDSNGHVLLRQAIQARTVHYKGTALLVTDVAIPGSGFWPTNGKRVLRYEPTISFPPELGKGHSSGSVDAELKIIHAKTLCP